MEAARRFLTQAGDLRRTGSAAIDLCDVACGRTDIYFELRLRPWDVAAGALLVWEAGGAYISLGRETPWFEGPCGMLACNSKCLDHAGKILEEEAK